jgi:8-amino-7-oxononanoate synthase
MANLALVSTLAGPDDAIFSDALNHASLIDGCRLSRAAVHVYRHADAEHLESLLHREGGRARRRLIVSDSVFSMDGDLAPLGDLLDVARRHDAVVLLDEAHATGVLGESGRGLSESVAPDPEHLIKLGTLSKALGAQGGFVCGPRRLTEWLVNHARPYIFSTALAPPTTAAARAAVALVRTEPERRRHLLHLARLLRERLRGIPRFASAASISRSQIVPIVLGSAGAALELSARLQEKGFLVPAIRPPSVAEGKSRLRVSLSAAHSEEDVLRLAACLAS